MRRLRPSSCGDTAPPRHRFVSARLLLASPSPRSCIHAIPNRAGIATSLLGTFASRDRPSPIHFVPLPLVL